MKATLFEFRHRWWIIASIFFVAFFAYRIDHINCAEALSNWTSARFGIADSYNVYRLIFAFGTCLLALAAFLRTWGTAYLQADVMRDSRVHTERLLADGPYRYVRNPLYLGNILLSIAIGLMASRVGFFILSIGMTVFVVRLILREESDLLRDQGESYRRYVAAVPRLLASLTPRVPSAGNVPHWAQAFRAELMYWLLGLAMASFAVTLNLKVFWAVFAVAIIASFAYKRPDAKKRSDGGQMASDSEQATDRTNS
jgi:protein-S-isoprenylcysteine O-methyltransferase Ste14